MPPRPRTFLSQSCTQKAEMIRSKPLVLLLIYNNTHRNRLKSQKRKQPRVIRVAKCYPQSVTTAKRSMQNTSTVNWFQWIKPAKTCPTRGVDRSSPSRALTISICPRLYHTDHNFEVSHTLGTHSFTGTSNKHACDRSIISDFPD